MYWAETGQQLLLAADPPPFATIRRSLEEYRQTINSMKVVYEVRRAKNLSKIGADEWGRVPVEEWIWAIDGRKRLLKQLPSDTLDKGFHRQIYRSFDGSIGYSLSHHASDDSLVCTITKTPYQPDGLAGFQHVADALGWQSVLFNSKDATKESNSFLSLVSKAGNPVMDEGVCDSSGVLYPRMQLGSFPSTGIEGPPHEITAFFSPSHGLLPKHIRAMPAVSVLPNGKEEVMPSGSFPFILDVLEYRQVEDPLFKRPRWFPQRFVVQLAGAVEVTVVEVEINQPLPARTFVPDEPFGTEIVTIIAGSTTSKKSYIGGEEGERLFNERLYPPNPAKLTPVPNRLHTVDATPKRGVSWIAFFGIGSLILLGTAFVAARRRAV